MELESIIFRSTNDGASWAPGVQLYAEADGSAKLAVDGTTVHVCFGAKLTTNFFGGRSTCRRSTGNGQTWSAPVFIGEASAESGVQARQQIAAADGHVFAIWQREANIAGGHHTRLEVTGGEVRFRRRHDGAEVAVKAGCCAVVAPNVPLVAKPVHTEPHRVP